MIIIHNALGLEYRRLLPRLSQEFNVYAVDLLGWGFSNISDVKTFYPEAKIEHLKNFLEQVVQRPCILVGASLGIVLSLVYE